MSQEDMIARMREKHAVLKAVLDEGGHWIFAVTCLFALLMVASAYSNSLHNSFHFDDSHVIINNLYIRSLTNIGVFFTDAQTFSSLPANATYRPLVTVSLALDYWLGGGLAPWQFHVSQFGM